MTRAYLAALGSPSDVSIQAEVIAAAELRVIAEEARAGALRQADIFALDQVVRVQGAADRALRRLGIKPGAQRKSPTLAEHLARRASERAAKAAQ